MVIWETEMINVKPFQQCLTYSRQHTRQVSLEDCNPPYPRAGLLGSARPLREGDERSCRPGAGLVPCAVQRESSQHPARGPALPEL